MECTTNDENEKRHEVRALRMINNIQRCEWMMLKFELFGTNRSYDAQHALKEE